MQISHFDLFPQKKVYFNGYVKTAPQTFPSDSDDIEELPDGYEFRLGSWIYAIDAHEVYMWDGTQFVSQKGE